MPCLPNITHFTTRCIFLSEFKLIELTGLNYTRFSRYFKKGFKDHVMTKYST